VIISGIVDHHCLNFLFIIEQFRRIYIVIDRKSTVHTCISCEESSSN